jgi:hypothetical protein
MITIVLVEHMRNSELREKLRKHAVHADEWIRRPTVQVHRSKISEILRMRPCEGERIMLDPFGPDGVDAPDAAAGRLKRQVDEERRLVRVGRICRS